MNNEARAQGAILGQAYNPIGAASYGAANALARSLTIGEEIDAAINRMEGRLESLRLIKSKFASGGALSVSLADLRRAMDQY